MQAWVEVLWKVFVADYLWVILVGVVFFLYGLWRNYKIYRTVRGRGSFVSELPQTLTDVPDSSISAWDHVVAGGLLFSGISLVVGAIVAWFLWADSTRSGIAATGAGVVLGVLTLGLVLWNLNKTGRLARLQGERIQKFDVLVERMTEDLTFHVKEWDDGGDRSKKFRVYLLTNNPYFGVNSHPGTKRAIAFTGAFCGIKKRLSRPLKQTPFNVWVLCANKHQLGEFNKCYGDRNGYTLARRNQESEKFIKLLKNISASCIRRVPHKIAEIQFAVIGNVVFEFTLEPPLSSAARGSNIRHTTRSDDPDIADRFERYMDFLMHLAKTAGPKSAK